MLIFLMRNLKKVIALTLLVAIFISSVTIMGEKYTDPQTYGDTVKSIDDKKVTVLGVSAAIAGSATLLETIHSEVTNHITGELKDLSFYLLIVTFVLVLEKSLLTVFGAVSCYCLVPITCVCFIIAILRRNKHFQYLAMKIGILALALLMIVPVSMRLSDYIYEINQVTIEQEIEDVGDVPISEETDADTPWYTRLWNTVTETVKSTADAAIESGQKALNKFIDAVAVFVIAYCAVPILAALVFLWLIKFLFGLNVDKYVSTLNPKSFREQRAMKRLESNKLMLEDEDNY